GPRVRWPLFLILCMGLYHSAGMVSLIFAVLVGLGAMRDRRRWPEGLGAMAIGFSVPWLVGTQWHYMTALEAYSLAWPFGFGRASDIEPLPLSVLRLVFLLPVLVLAYVVCRERLENAGDSKETGRVVAKVSLWEKLGVWLRPGLAELIASAGLVAIVAAGHCFLRASELHVRFQMVHAATEGNWKEVLRAARQVPPDRADLFYTHLVDRALFHTGRLLDDLFSFSQHPAALLLVSEDVPPAPPRFWMVSQVALELGDINLAEQWAYGMVEGVGECPRALETLALICVAKGQKEAARVLLRKMGKIIFCGNRAAHLLSLVDQPIDTDAPWLQRARHLKARRCREDYAVQVYSEEQLLRNLLGLPMESRPESHTAPPEARFNNTPNDRSPLVSRNRMAWEYLMAFYLLTRQTDKILEHLDDWMTMTDTTAKLPRHIEEAVVIHEVPEPQRAEVASARRKRSVSDETLQRFQQFVVLYGQLQSGVESASEALARELGDTYFLYHVFGVSGAKR
ncbi:MAG: hypothetical protein GXP27_04850, partial [Planctomycetes bacterium]|nr:hypothetical protein [Planctomycetota bacterium]